ncbi:MAG: glutamine-hydrolyzing carbamoyl-phosphate synthase small subunit [Eubacteriales bacterium]|nr:glutamine-hydrolyzing carbamoyl-phosphate synthase small subunit [Eubacteriales bacterium]
MSIDQKIRKIVLEDGSVYSGTGFGSFSNKKVEIVFNTSMVGYQEIISDPSYTDQMVVMTYPLIGNYGICDEDYETEIPTISGLIVRENCNTPSNFRTTHTLEEIMKKYDIVGVEGIDTRKLARHIRDFGSCKAFIVSEDYDLEAAKKELQEWIPRTDAVARVSTKTIYEFTEEADAQTNAEMKNKPYHVVAIDCGIKKNILREMKKRGLRVTVVPWDTSAQKIQELQPDGIFISNGPGDPTDVETTIQTIRESIGKCPIFGICLGHQIISLAYGAKTYKLKFGHRGGNHPVKNLRTDKVEITSQNHSYAVNEESLSNTLLEATHRNLLDQTIEGVACEKDFVFSVQYHPESAPGPQDSSYLFDIFIENMKRWTTEHTADKISGSELDSASYFTSSQKQGGEQ